MGILDAVNDPSNAYVVGTIRNVAQQLGVDPNLALAIAYNESGFNPTAVGDQGTSFGLFQLHKGGELGTMTPAQAFDPTTNAQTSLSRVANIRGSGGTPGEVAAAAQRPANPQAYAASVDSLYDQLAGKPTAPYGGLGGLPYSGPAGQIFAGPVGGSAGGGQTEGFLFSLHIPGDGDVSIQRSTVRKIVGGAVLVVGGVVSLAGLFLLSGRRAPGPIRVIQTSIEQRGRTTRTERTQAGLTEREQLRSERAAQRRQESRARAARNSPEGRSRAAQAEAERDAEAAGPF